MLTARIEPSGQTEKIYRLVSALESPLIHGHSRMASDAITPKEDLVGHPNSGSGLLQGGEQGRVSAKQPAMHSNDGAFDGSFAGTIRGNTELYVRPWYRRKEYFTEGWADASVWKAAVSSPRLRLRMNALC